MRFAPSSRAGQVRLFALLAIFVAIVLTHRDECSFLLTRTPVLYRYFAYHPQEGDIVFQSLPHADLIDAIEGVTHSPYSHCGVVLLNDRRQWVVIEAITNVHETPLILWMLRGRGGNIAAYRLKAHDSSSIPVFKHELLADLGSRYDFNYDMTNDKSSFYCSDLIYRAFLQATGEKLGRLEKLEDLDWKPFEKFIRADQQNTLPLDRVMITPASLAAAPQLTKIYGY